jgi:hypothetical protein
MWMLQWIFVAPAIDLADVYEQLEDQIIQWRSGKDWKGPTNFRIFSMTFVLQALFELGDFRYKLFTGLLHFI